ncbi:MAG TPA: dihydrodipicolinate reductase [Myxococcota bacterium]
MVVRVVVIGAGPIGVRVAQEIRTRTALELVAIVDIDANKRGTVVESIAITDALPDRATLPAGSVAVLTTTSSLEKLEPQALPLLARGLHVVSTCEELAWPWSRAERAASLDKAARAAGVCVLGTGVNPGFVMDALPLFLTATSARVDSVAIERVQDSSTRRRPFQDKTGVGKDPDVVRAAVDAEASGHVGLKESAAMLAVRLGFAIDHTELTNDVVIASTEVALAGRTVRAGECLGVVQRLRASAKGTVLIDLHFRAVFGEPRSFDRVVVEGAPRVDATLEGGLPGDLATAAIVANAIASVLSAKPGLRTMADVPLVSFAR